MADTAPGTAGDLYAELVEETIQRRSNSAYDGATALLRKVDDLWSRAGRQAEFATFLENVRERHGRKRNLMQRLEAAFGPH